MKVLVSWLREFVDIKLPPRELAKLLTMSGSEVASVEEVGSNWSKVHITQVRSLRPHPNAERLTLAEVDLGDRTIELVTGATNLKIGDRVPAVLSGGSLQPGVTIGAVNFRGIVSEGMLCSGIELGISPDGEGIYVLEEDAPIGVELREYLEDAIIDLELTPNRPDCLSIIGMAREVAALTGESFRVPETRIVPGEFRAADCVTVEISAPDLCPRYTALVIRNVEIKPSPLWIQRRLYYCGVRPISNIVDVTNYVMLERGQPLHAFDARKLEGGIIVRRANPGEVMVTLDGEPRNLTSETLVIADHAKAVAIAGVMGGLYSEIDDTTTEIVLEAANFSLGSVRRTTRDIRLATEASKRFDKGLDPEMTLPSGMRAAAMMAELGGGSVGQGVVDVYPGPVYPTTLYTNEADIQALLGLRFERDEMERIFGSLGFETRDEGEKLKVVVPTFRRDVEGRADLAEELARIKGYDSLPETLPTGQIPQQLSEPAVEWASTAREVLAGAGLQEIISYSLVDGESAKRVSVDVGPGAATISTEMIGLLNPMTPEQAYLRTTLIHSMLKTIAANMRHQTRAYLFEIGRVYLPPLNPLPTERRTVAIALTGSRQPEAWNSPPQDGDFFDLKGEVEALMRAMGIEGVVYRPGLHVSMHPGRAAEVVAGGKLVGHIGEIHPIVVERYDLQPRRVYAGELDFDALISMATSDRGHRSLPRFPAVSHDIAVVVDVQVPNAEVEKAIAAVGAPLLEKVELFDLYRGSSIPEGKKSLAYALSYRSPERTLTDDEVAAVEARIVEQLSALFGAFIRSK